MFLLHDVPFPDTRRGERWLSHSRCRLSSDSKPVWRSVRERCIAHTTNSTSARCCSRRIATSFQLRGVHQAERQVHQLTHVESYCTLTRTDCRLAEGRTALQHHWPGHLSIDVLAHHWITSESKGKSGASLRQGRSWSHCFDKAHPGRRQRERLAGVLCNADACFLSG